MRLQGCRFAGWAALVWAALMLSTVVAKRPNILMILTDDQGKLIISLVLNRGLERERQRQEVAAYMFQWAGLPPGPYAPPNNQPTAPHCQLPVTRRRDDAGLCAGVHAAAAPACGRPGFGAAQLRRVNGALAAQL